jgi:hypothetical protein
MQIGGAKEKTTATRKLKKGEDTETVTLPRC